MKLKPDLGVFSPALGVSMGTIRASECEGLTSHSTTRNNTDDDDDEIAYFTVCWKTRKLV